MYTCKNYFWLRGLAETTEEERLLVMQDIESILNSGGTKVALGYLVYADDMCIDRSKLTFLFKVEQGFSQYTVVDIPVELLAVV